MKPIEIIVSPEGRTTVQTKGFHGSSCREASRFIERAIGNPTEEKLTTEFYQAESVQQTRQQQS